MHRVYQKSSRTRRLYMYGVMGYCIFEMYFKLFFLKLQLSVHPSYGSRTEEYQYDHFVVFIIMSYCIFTRFLLLNDENYILLSILNIIVGQIRKR